MERNDLKNALMKMLPAIAKPGDSQARDCILFRGDTIAAFNDGFGVQLLLNSGVNCAVMAEPLLKLLRSSKTKEIKLTIDDGKLVVTSGKSDAHLPLVDAKSYERYERILPEVNAWRPLPPDFTERMGMAFMPSDFKLSGVYMHQDVLLSSTPNWIMHVEVDASLDRCWITNKAVQALLKFGHVHEIAKVHSWVHFRNEQGTFSCRHLVADSYPADQIFASERTWVSEGEVVCSGVIDQETISVLKEARVFAEVDGAEEGEMSLKVVFHFDSEGMAIQTESSLGNFRARADIAMQMEEPVTVTTDLSRLLMAMEREVSSFQLVRHRNEHFMVVRGPKWQMLLAATVPQAEEGVMEVKELEFGAPLGWTPKSLLTWNGSFLPYCFRFDDMRFDLGLGSLQERTVIEWDLLTGVKREWASYDAAEDALNLSGISQSMRKNALVHGHVFFHRKTNPPSAERIKKLTELAKVSRSFGYTPRRNKAKKVGT